MNWAKEYTDKVLTGEIVAGTKIKQAARRYRRDVKASKTDAFPYYFDEQKAAQAIEFVELMPARDGSVLKLELFQKWLLSELFGWRDKETGNRRYDRAYISMARKNGKSYLMASIGALYLLLEDRPARNREIVFTANSSQQAHLAYDMMASGLRQVAKVSQSLRQRLKINRDEVRDLETESKAVPLASDLHSLDGYQSDLAVIDEYALARTNEIYNVLKSGQINSDNSLLAVISTTGPDLNGPMYKEYKFVSQVLADNEQGDRYFIAIWEQDSRKEAHDPTKWEKSNPLLANEERAKTMRPSLQADMELAGRQNNLPPLLVKNFNMWVQARADSYISLDDWNKAVVEPPATMGGDVYLGLDLSKSSDLTSISWLLPMTGYLYADSFSFVGTKYGGIKEKSKRDGFDYLTGAQRGECNITQLASGVIDYDEVLNFILDMIDRNQWTVKAICYDPFAMGYLIPEFEKRNLPLIEVRQGVRTLSIPTIRFRDDLFNGKLKHRANELLGYAVNNAILKYDANNNPIIDKARNATKIDPIAALMNAYTVAMDSITTAESSEELNRFYASDDFSF
ncbi:terminase large subunit [Schleiferilactobacillus perolens]|jgi:phage terminase large subunit-like protein|uniref:terminase large subunit n=1 Tax=Schleiferilactobacillus perolens TaxID=100468 RepID=UPI0023578EAD|nr:terminase TerL endonuclease subunit [Schleiferilactobacillus perolens]MCI2170980.1 terminase large subunit [Schleiferilactobacillus perolens]